MRLKKVACGAAVIGMAAGSILISGASSASATAIQPYIGFTHGGVIAASDPGIWDDVTCLIAEDSGNPGDNGKINGVVVAGHAGQLNVTIGGLTTPVVLSSCVPTSISLTGSSTVTNGTKPGGVFAITTTAGVQGGVQALSITTIDVTLSAGQVLKQPTGSTIDSGSLTGPGTVRLDLKPVLVATKPVPAVPASCSDSIYVIDTGAHYADNIPKATEWDGTSNSAAGKYMATIRSCAGSTAPIAGKPLVTKLSVTGSGAVSASFYKAATVAPAVWDQTDGKCAVVKTVPPNSSNGGAGPTGNGFGDVTSATSLDSSRVIQCKGAYGANIPFSLDVRAFGTNGGEDPYGINHPAAISLGGGTFA